MAKICLCLTVLSHCKSMDLFGELDHFSIETLPRAILYMGYFFSFHTSRIFLVQGQMFYISREYTAGFNYK